MKRKTTLSLLPLAASLAFLLLQGCGGNIARMPSEAARESNTAGMGINNHDGPEPGGSLFDTSPSGGTFDSSTSDSGTSGGSTFGGGTSGGGTSDSGSFNSGSSGTDTTSSPALPPDISVGGPGVASTAARPEDDFYDSVNHALLDKVNIPEDSSGWSYFHSLEDKVYRELHTLLLEIAAGDGQYEAGSDRQKIASLYLTAMDLDARNSAGTGALERYLNEICSASGIDEYLSAAGRLSGELGCQLLLSVGCDSDMEDASRYACYIGTGNLGLGKETLEDSGQTALHGAYKKYIASMLVLSGTAESDAAQAADEIFIMMKDLASAALPLSTSSDPSHIYNPYTRDGVFGLLPGSKLETFLKAGSAGDFDRYIVMEPKYVKKAGEYLNREHLQLLKNYSVFCVMDHFASCLSEPVRDEALRFKQRLQGAAAVKSDEKLAGELTQNLLDFEFGRLYIENCFSDESRQAAKSIITRILDAYREKIDALDWMSAETKQAAKKKLECMTLKVGYPDRWPDSHSQAALLSPKDGGVLIDNVVALKKSETADERKRAHGPVDRSIWYMSPQTVNAYYNPLANEIVFPAAILQAPFFDPNAEDAQNLGGFGMVCAHEITHAFDNSGSQYDENGSYKTWWTGEDYANFRKKAQAVVDYYDGYKGFDNIPVNGAQTLGENIADLGAVSCVMQLAGNNPKTLRTLCTQFARIWASKYTDESMILRLNTDVHSPSKVRVNAVLSSMDGFYLAYPQIREGNGMYVAPEKRVNVW